MICLFADREAYSDTSLRARGDAAFAEGAIRIRHARVVFDVGTDRNRHWAGFIATPAPRARIRVDGSDFKQREPRKASGDSEKRTQ